MYQHRFHGIANPRTLHLGIETDFFGHGHVGPFVHIHMADTFVMFQYGYS